MNKLHFRAAKEWKLLHSLDQVTKYCEAWTEKRDSLPYEIDGIVVKVDQTALQSELASPPRPRAGPSPINFPRSRKSLSCRMSVLALAAPARSHPSRHWSR